MKNICVLLASPRKEGNTETLTIPFVEHMKKMKLIATYTIYIIWMYEHVLPVDTVNRIGVILTVGKKMMCKLYLIQ